MLPYLLLLVISTTGAFNCSYKFDGKSYTRTSVLTIKGLPTNLVYDSINDNLLFTLIDINTLQDDEEQTKMDQYVLKNGEPIKIDNVNGQASAVDEINKKVYIASDGGLNVLNSTFKASFVGLKDEDIVQIFKPATKNELYVVLFPENEVYVLNLDTNEKRKVAHVPCAYIIAVDSNDNIYYECDSKYVKVLLKDFQEPIEFAGIGKNSGRALAVDDKNRVILAANGGLYHLRPDNMIPKKLMNLDFIPSGLAIHGDYIYLSTNGVIYEYNPSKC